MIPVTRLPNGELTVKLGNLTLRGKSTGGKETAIIIEELSVIFDVGYQADKVETIQNVFVSHGHGDHIGCLHFCNYSRKLQNITNPWQVIMPQCCIEPFRVIATAVSSLARGGFPREFHECKFENDTTTTKLTIKPFDKLRIDKLIPAEECKDIPLIHKPNYTTCAYKMNHRITSFGYVISEWRKKLKKEFLSLSPAEIIAIKNTGTVLTEQIEILTVAFSGDTKIDAILANDKFLNAQILIMECTHFQYDSENPDIAINDAMLHGHVHFKQFVDNITQFKNKWIVLCHLSQKYRKMEDIEPYLKLIPPEQLARIVIWMT